MIGEAYGNQESVDSFEQSMKCCDSPLKTIAMAYVIMLEPKGESSEAGYETVTIVQVKKYDCFDQGKSNSYSKEEVQFGYILKGQPIRYLDKLDLECEKDYQQ